ncbi:MAG: disulfide bond formation protein B [Microthrixaceae bacterium]
MEVETVTTFFALLAVLGIVFLVAVLVLAIIAKARGDLPEGLLPLREGLGSTALMLGCAVAAVCMFGSLYLSEIAKFPPCQFCWYQRIAMYPMTLLLGIAAFRKDSAIKYYTIPLGIIGAGLSTYHYLIERFPDSVAHACTEEVPCSTVWIWKFHFLSIPAMAGIGFLLIVTLSILATPRVRGDRSITETADQSA